MIDAVATARRRPLQWREMQNRRGSGLPKQSWSSQILNSPSRPSSTGWPHPVLNVPTITRFASSLTGTARSRAWLSTRPSWLGIEHFDGTRFFNPGQPSTDRGLVDILRWRLTSAAAHWPKSVAVTTAKPDGRVSGLRI